MMILIVWLRKLKFERIFSFYLHVCNFKFRNSKNIVALRRVSLVFSKLFRSFPNVRQTKGTLPSHLPNCRAVGFGSPLLQNPCSVRYILCWIMAPIEVFLVCDTVVTFNFKIDTSFLLVLHVLISALKNYWLIIIKLLYYIIYSLTTMVDFFWLSPTNKWPSTCGMSISYLVQVSLNFGNSASMISC